MRIRARGELFHKWGQATLDIQNLLPSFGSKAENRWVNEGMAQEGTNHSIFGGGGVGGGARKCHSTFYPSTQSEAWQSAGLATVCLTPETGYLFLPRAGL